MFDKLTKQTRYQKLEQQLNDLKGELKRYAQIAEDLHDHSLFGMLMMKRGTFHHVVSLARELDVLNQHLPEPEQLTLCDVKLRHKLPMLVYEVNRLLRLYLASEAASASAQNATLWNGLLEREELDFLVQTVRMAEQQQQQQTDPTLFDHDPYYLNLPYRNQVYEMSQMCSQSFTKLNDTLRAMASILLVLCCHIEQLDLLIPLTFEQERDVLLQRQEEWCMQNAEAMERWRGRVEYELTHDISTQATPAQWQEAFVMMKQDWADNESKLQAVADQSPAQYKSMLIYQFLIHYEYPGNSYNLQSRDIVQAMIRLIVEEDIDVDELFRLMERYNTIVRTIRRQSMPTDPEQKFRQEVLAIAGKAREYWDEDKAPIEAFDLIWNDWLCDPRVLELMRVKAPASIGLDLNLKLILNLTGILLQKMLIKVPQTKLSKEMHPDGKRADSYLTGYAELGSKDSALTQPLLDFALKVITGRISSNNKH